MPLDIAILGVDGRPEEEIQIQLEPHVRLMVLAEEARLRLLSRLRDYYEDADYDLAELGPLLEEVEMALERARGDLDVTEFLSCLQRLASDALRKGVGLAAIAD